MNTKNNFGMIIQLLISVFLSSIMLKYITNRKGKLHCAFIDFREAFHRLVKQITVCFVIKYRILYMEN